MLSNGAHTAHEIAVLKTVASTREGIDALATAIELHQQQIAISDKKIWLLTERVYQLIQKKKMQGVEKEAIRNSIALQIHHQHFNLFDFAKKYSNAL
jgi:LAO/AO transport system kinase